MTTIFCDGGSRGNPGKAASAFVVTKNEKVIFKDSKFLGIETNNVAEYNAVLMAVTWLTHQAGHQLPVIINLDSQLVERQLNGKYKIKNPKLKKLSDEIKSLILSSKLSIKFQWNFREKNVLADNLVNRELDYSTGK